jgi:hypothetical protein
MENESFLLKGNRCYRMTIRRNENMKVESGRGKKEDIPIYAA